MPSITLGNSNPIQTFEKFPSDNFAPRSRIISNNLGLNKIYYPRDFDRKEKKINFKIYIKLVF